MKGDRTFDDVAAVVECRIQEMSVKFEIYGRFQVQHQRDESLPAAKFVSRAHIGDRAPAKVLCLEQLSDEQVAIVYKRAELRCACAQALHRARTIYDIGVRRVARNLSRSYARNVRSPSHSTINSLPRAIASCKQR